MRFRLIIFGMLLFPLWACDDDPNGRDKGADTSEEDSENDGQNGGEELCEDFDYLEEISQDLPSIEDLKSMDYKGDVEGFVLQVLERRYPKGAWLAEEGNRIGTGPLGQCIKQFARNGQDLRQMLMSISTVVHECGHALDLEKSEFNKDHFAVHESLFFECKDGDAKERMGKTFARSLINLDEYSALLSDDFYKDTYLDGDPSDRIFDSGDQGFNMLLEELFQYINSLATDYHLRDELGGYYITAVDGALTFLWYLERYLRMARLDYPEAYTLLSEDPCWQDAILTAWDRAWLYLNLAMPEPQLNIDMDILEPLVTDPELVEEVERIRRLRPCR